MECILKDNTRSCVTSTEYGLFCCNDVCISCLVQHSTSDTCYFVLTYENERFFLSEPFNLNSLLKKVNDIFRLDDCINDGKENLSYFLFYSSAVSNEERKNIVRKLNLSKKRLTSTVNILTTICNWSQQRKKQRYSSMDRAKKDELLETCAKKYKDMDASKKKQFLKNQRKNI